MGKYEGIPIHFIALSFSDPAIKCKEEEKDRLQKERDHHHLKIMNEI